MEYDSWVTIDAAFTGDGEGELGNVDAVGAFTDFEAGSGFFVNDPFGIAVHHLRVCN